MTERFDLEKAVKIVGLNIHAENADEGKDFDVACRMIVNALEEVKAYRKIGLTPELIEAMQGHNIALINDLGEYQQIGTIEEFKALKEKNEPKKPYQDKHLQHTYFCSCCGYTLAESVADDCCLEEEMAGWCPNCGQKLDWSE